jgi:hypothetical protein
MEPVAAGLETKALPADTGSKKGVQYLGKNQKNICLLVGYPNDVYLPDDQLNFLTNILQACRLNMADVAIVNHTRTAIGFEDLQQQLHCHYLLVFGVAPAAIGLEESPLFTAHAVNGCSIVLSPAAEQLNNNNQESKLLKSQLWICLKQLFSV